MEKRKKEIIKHSIAISILIIIIAIVIIIILKYQVSGETNMPFKLSKITIISTAEGEQRNTIEGEENYKWNFNINQNNDIYFFIDKNDEYNGISKINNISIENINIVQKPSIGTIRIYMPDSDGERVFSNEDDYLVTDTLTYTGAKASNPRTLEVGNQGGKVLIRFANSDITQYKSNDDLEIKHDGTLLGKAGIKNENIKFVVNFDFIITIGQIKYKANITLELPYDNVIESGTTELEKTDMSDIVFKRIQKNT